MTMSTEAPATAPESGIKSDRIAAFEAVCRRAANGDLEARISGFSDDPQWQPLASAINDMLDMADSYVRESAAAMDHCSRDLYYRPVLLRGIERIHLFESPFESVWIC